MTHRCTFALDAATTARIRRLAALWEVSQAEVIRRVVASAEAPETRMDPAARLRRLHDSGEGLREETAHDYLGQVRSDRKRTVRVDAMIAGTAIAAGARLATNYREDFRPFTPHGLRLV